MRSRPPRDVPAEDDEADADADADDDDSERAPVAAVGESGGDETAVALQWPQNRPGRLSLKLLLLLLLLLRFGDRRFDGGSDTSMLPISELSL